MSARMTICSKFNDACADQFDPPVHGYGTGLWDKGKLQLFASCVVYGVSGVGLRLIKNVHDQVMTEKRATCKKVCMIPCLNAASIVLVPVAVLESGLSLLSTTVVGLPSLLMGPEFFILSTMGLVSRAANVPEAFYTMRHVTFGLSNKNN